MPRLLQQQSERRNQTTFHVLPARPGDLDFLVNANLATDERWGCKDLDKTALRRAILAQMMNPQLGRYWVAWDGPDPVGQMRVWREYHDWSDSWAWWLDNVLTVPSHRGQGVFRWLFDHVLGLAREANVCRIRLQVDPSNTTAIAAYEALGFRKTNVVMEKNLFST